MTPDVPWRAGCVNAKDDELCDDGVGCTTNVCTAAGGEKEEAGTGCTYTPDDGQCGDGVGCTDDSCSATQGCQNEPDDSKCTDTVRCAARLLSGAAAGSWHWHRRARLRVAHITSLTKSSAASQLLSMLRHNALAIALQHCCCRCRARSALRACFNAGARICPEHHSDALHLTEAC